MSRRIAIASGKGGVGKTTTVTNLAASLASHGHAVIAVDANFTAPNLGLHLGAPANTIHFHHVLRHQAKVHDAIHTHDNGGFHYIPAGLTLDDVRQVDIDAYLNSMADLHGHYDFILLDCAPGLGSDAMVGIGSAQELLVVVNPEWPSIADAMKTIKFAEELGVYTTGVILNKRRNEGIEPPTDQIESFLDAPIIAEVPEDHNVRKGIAYCRPVVLARPNSGAARTYRKLGSELVGREFVHDMTAIDRLREMWKDLIDEY